MKKGLALLVAAMAVLALGASAFAADIDWTTVKVTSPDGKEMVAKEFFGGKAAILTFAQTACASCREEITYIGGAMKDYPNVIPVAVMVDMRASAEKINGYLNDVSWKGMVLTDPKFALAKLVGVNMTPASVIISADGKVQKVLAGYDENIKKSIGEELKKVK